VELMTTGASARVGGNGNGSEPASSLGSGTEA
jgi:hypothetical protein